MLKSCTINYQSLFEKNIQEMDFLTDDLENKLNLGNNKSYFCVEILTAKIAKQNSTHIIDAINKLGNTINQLSINISETTRQMLQKIGAYNRCSVFSAFLGECQGQV
jgi:hypothetical protein